jgi:hypothetical protein
MLCGNGIVLLDVMTRCPPDKILIGLRNYFSTVKTENPRFIGFLWRKRVGVEPTTLAAKDRINGFEGHEDHRTSFASTACINIGTGSLVHIDNTSFFRSLLGCSCGVGRRFNSRYSLMKI